MIPLAMKSCRIKRFWTDHRFTIAILGLALALRLINLGSRPLWYDEAFAVLYAEKPVDQIMHGTVTAIEGAAAADVHPVLYYLGLHGWIELVGESPFAVRFLSVVFGVATVWLVGRLASLTKGELLGRYAMAIAAIAPFPIAYSQEARMYGLLALCAIGATYSGWRGLIDRRWWAVYAVLAALTLYAHNLGALTLIPLNLFLLARLLRPFEPARLFPWLWANLGGAILFAPWLVLVLPGQIGFVRRGYWLSPPGFTELVRSLLVYHFNLPLPTWLLPFALFLALAILGLVIVRIIKTKAGTPFGFLFLGIAPMGLMWLISQWQAVYIERALLPAGLLYLVAVAWFLSDCNLPRPLRLGVGGGSLMIVCLSLAFHYGYHGFPRAHFAEADAYLRTEAGEGDVIIHSNKLTFFPMHYYDRQLPATWIADPPGDGSDTLARPTQEALNLYPQPNLEAAVGEAEQIWFVIFKRAISEYDGQHPHLVWLDRNFTLTDTAQYDELLILHYERHGTGEATAGPIITLQGARDLVPVGVSGLVRASHPGESARIPLRLTAAELVHLLK